MKTHPILFLLLTIAIMLSGCVSSSSVPETASSTPEFAILTVSPILTAMPMVAATHLPSPTANTPTSTLTQTPPLTPPPTLEPEQAEEIISTLLREPVDCPAPCFWGIVPGQTTLSEARDIFTHFGLEMASTTYEGTDFHGIRYDFDSGMSIIVTLTVQDDLVTNLRVNISPEKYQLGVQREWLAYSPETLISRYGTPSNVEFFVGRAAPVNTYSMVMYFDTVDMIIEYYGNDLPFNDGSFIICPLNSGFDVISIWLGANPEKPPLVATPLEEATSISLEKFAELMTADPQNACFALREDAFP